MKETIFISAPHVQRRGSASKIRAEAPSNPSATDRVPTTQELSHDAVLVSSRSQLAALSEASTVLLVTISSGNPPKHSNKLESKLQGFVRSVLEPRQIRLLFCDIGWPRSDLAKYLKDQNLNFTGCFLVADGRIVQSKKSGTLSEEGITKCVRELLRIKEIDKLEGGGHVGGC